jgi:molecular chaperone DnaK
VRITRTRFESLVEDLVDKTLDPCQIALDDAGLTIGDVDAVLLVGGMTRMPRVQERVAEFFGRAPSKGVNPDEVVAIGAAIQGGVLTGEVDNVLLLDVIPLSLGVETQGGVFTKIIDRNTTIPYSRSNVFSTAVDNQPMVSVHVLQGEREMAKDNRSLARFDLVGIPPAPRGVPQIEVTFEVDTDGILHVSARDRGTGREQSVQVHASSGLTEREIERMVEDAQSHKRDDEMRKKLVELRNTAEHLMHSTESSLKEFGEMLSPLDVEEIRTDLDTLRAVMNTQDPDELRLAIQNLEQSAYRIADAMYSDAARNRPDPTN